MTAANGGSRDRRGLGVLILHAAALLAAAIILSSTAGDGAQTITALKLAPLALALVTGLAFYLRGHRGGRLYTGLLIFGALGTAAALIMSAVLLR